MNKPKFESPLCEKCNTKTKFKLGYYEKRIYKCPKCDHEQIAIRKEFARENIISTYINQQEGKTQ